MTSDDSGFERKQKRSKSRRSVLRRVAAAAALGVGHRSMLARSARGETDTVEKTDATVKSFDGTTIALSRYERDPESSHPAVIVAQAGVSPRSAVDTRARTLASDGYVALTYDPRGVGESEGKLRFGGHRDLEDISVLLDYLAERESVQTDASDDPRVGVEGTSAGGWRALRAASQDDRIDSLTCLFTPYDAAASVGTGGVLKWPWTYFLYLGVRAGPVRPTEGFLELTEQAVDSREPPEKLVEFFRERSPKGSLEAVRAPTLVVNGWHDRAFPPNDTFELYRGLAPAEKRRLTLVDFGHDFEDAPFDRAQFEFVRELRRDWLATQLRDETPQESSPLTDPSVHFYHAQLDTFEAYEELPAGERSFPLREGTEDKATKLDTEEGTDDRAEFDFAVEADLELAGVSHLSVDATPTDGDPHLFAALVDVPPEDSDAEPTHIKDQITAAEVTEPGTVAFDLGGVRRTVPAGHTLRLVLTLNDDEMAGFEGLPGPLFSDGLYVDTAPPTGVVIHHSRGRDSTLRVTTTETE